MNLTSLSDVRALLSELRIRPSKPLGQNFLVDRNILEILLRASDLRPGDNILEIGPGLGVVTEALLAAGARVNAIEKDRGLFNYLSARYGDNHCLTLVHGDALEMTRQSSGEEQAFPKVVSNLPYSVGTRILMNLVSSEWPPELLVVTVQQEVAQRFAAEAGDPDYGLAGIWAQLMFDVQIVKTISASCFWPRPEVESCVVKMVRHERSALSFSERQRLYKWTRASFQHRRKQLASVFGQSRQVAGDREAWRAMLKEAGLDERARPGEVSVTDWCRLAHGK